jgi:hypothetical protein
VAREGGRKRERGKERLKRRQEDRFTATPADGGKGRDSDRHRWGEGR